MHRTQFAEFQAWREDCPRWRLRLTIINTVFVGLLWAFTLMICLLLSAAFTVEECVSWVAAVGQSLMMQVSGLKG